MITLEKLAADILNHACPNGGTDEISGWHRYVIETHCVEWEITAKKIDGTWVIRSATAEDC